MLPLLWEKGSNGRKLTFRRTKGKEWKWQGHDRNGKGKTGMKTNGKQNARKERTGKAKSQRGREGEERKTKKECKERYGKGKGRNGLEARSRKGNTREGNGRMEWT